MTDEREEPEAMTTLHATMAPSVAIDGNVLLVMGNDHGDMLAFVLSPTDAYTAARLLLCASMQALGAEQADYVEGMDAIGRANGRLARDPVSEWESSIETAARAEQELVQFKQRATD